MLERVRVVNNCFGLVMNRFNLGLQFSLRLDNKLSSCKYRFASKLESKIDGTKERVAKKYNIQDEAPRSNCYNISEANPNLPST